MRKTWAFIVAITLTASLMAGCGEKQEQTTVEIDSTDTTTADTDTADTGVETDTDTANADSAEEITLTVAGPWSDCKAIETAATIFSEEYPNVHIVYEYLQDFNNTLAVRLEQEEDKIDLYLTNNIQPGSELIDYTQELSSLGSELDLSNTYEGLLNNFKLQSTDPEEQEHFYAVPLGGEVRGIYVNTSLLSSVGLDVPTDRESFMEACKVLKENGYTAVQGNPGMMAQRLLYPYVCSLIANAEDYDVVYQMVNDRAEGTAQLFQEPMQLMYDLMENEYYNYKYAETELGLFLDSSDEGSAKDFFNIKEDTRQDGFGQVAFFPATLSVDSIMEKTKEDYHSTIEYEFILAPVGEDGGYAYLSPGRGIAMNKATDNQEWCVKFLNFLFQEKNNIIVAEEMGFIPNTQDAMQYIEDKFNIPKNHISQLGQVTFSYSFFDVINNSLIEISKGNNPKYMETLEDGTTQLYSFEHYMENLENGFAQVEE